MSLSSSNYALNKHSVDEDKNTSSSRIINILNEGSVSLSRFDIARALAKQFTAAKNSVEQIEIFVSSIDELAKILPEKSSPHPFTILVAEFYQDMLFYFLEVFSVEKLIPIFNLEKGLHLIVSIKALIEESYSLPVRLKILKELSDAVLHDVFKTVDGYHSLQAVSLIVSSTPKLNAKRLRQECKEWLAVIDKELAECKTQPEELTRYAFQRLGNKYLGDQITSCVDHIRSDKAHDLYLIALEVIDADYLRSLVISPAVMSSVLYNIEYGYTKTDPSPIHAHILFLEKIGKDHLKNMFKDPIDLSTFKNKLDSRLHAKLDEMLEVSIESNDQSQNQTPRLT